MLKDSVIQFLKDKGAGDARHSGRTLLDHLVGTYNLLKECGNPESTCIVGLLHSVYGTEFFKSGLDNISKNEIVSLVGAKIERKIKLFCIVKKSSFYCQELENEGLYTVSLLDDNKIELERNEIIEIGEVDIVNISEQIDNSIKPSKEMILWMKNILRFSLKNCSKKSSELLFDKITYLENRI